MNTLGLLSIIFPIGIPHKPVYLNAKLHTSKDEEEECNGNLLHYFKSAVYCICQDCSDDEVTTICYTFHNPATTVNNSLHTSFLEC